jgi:hypothetical protein
MKITIEPTEQRRVETVDTMHSKISVSIASDDLDITEAMEQVVKALQAWGFHNESIAGQLDEELAWSLGLQGKTPEETFMNEAGLVGGGFLSTTADAISKDVIKIDPALEQDKTPKETVTPSSGCCGAKDKR